MDNPSVPAIQHRRRRWPVILSVAVVVPAAVLAFLWFGLAPSVPAKPIRLVRGENGQMVPADSPEEPGFVSFEVQTGKINANNTFSASSVTARSDHSGFACARLVILNRSDHLLMARIGPLLLDELKPLGYIRQIDYYPAGFSPERGNLTADVTIIMDMEQLAESSGPASHTVEATFTVTAGNRPPGCRSSSIDSLTPPLVQFDWSGRLHHTSTTTGLSSSAAKYKLVAENVAKQIAQTLTKEFRERQEKEGALPELPRAFYPAYREPPTLPLEEFGSPQVVTSSHGLMNHNETFWRLPINRPAADLLGEMQQRLEATGWKTRSRSKAPAQDYLRMARNDAALVIYAPSPRETPPSSSPKEPILYVHYVDRMTQNEMRSAIDESLAKGVSTDVLIRFQRQWSQDQSSRILQLLRSRPVRTPQTSIALANLYHQLKQDDNARAELLHACALLRTVAQYSDLQGKVRSLAKDLGDEKLAEKPLEPRVLDELGFVELKPGTRAASREIGVDEPVHFYARTADGSLRTISLRVIKSPANDSGAYQLAFVDANKDGRSWGTGGASHGSSLDNGCRVTFALERLDTTERFRLNTQLSGPPERRGPPQAASSL
ncbi:MAG: hypothetical protein ACYC0Y_15990 [Pirellulales bacterium]